MIKAKPKTEAELEADRIDEKIIDLLKQNKSFRVEAGAGAGKTTSLTKIAQWLDENKSKEYNRKGQKVACITFTNVVVNVIENRISQNSSVVPSTIHSFAWDCIYQFKNALIEMIKTDPNFRRPDGDINTLVDIQYTLGHKALKDGILFLGHDDVIYLFSSLLDKEKFRKYLQWRYPWILIDEYQDSHKSIMDKFVRYFIETATGPRFGLFGDAWQTIYSSNGACGLVNSKNLEVVEKTVNFRSPKNIVNMLNYIRPDLPQKTNISDYDGEVYVITNGNYDGFSFSRNDLKAKLPDDECKERIDKISKIVENSTGEKVKSLMITHRALANQRGYNDLFAALENGIKDKDDPLLAFVAQKIEPIYESLKNGNSLKLFDLLGIRQYPIRKKADKNAWHQTFKSLESSREKAMIDVLNVIHGSGLIPFPTDIEDTYNQYFNAPDEKYLNNDVTVKNLLDIDYMQFADAGSFQNPDSSFSTDHGVKGEEYTNVLFAITRHWPMYKFDKYLPMMNEANVPAKDLNSYIRNRNLFYVCCSRSIKRLYIFVAHPISKDFGDYLKKMVGEENYLTYEEFLKKSGERFSSRLLNESFLG